MPLASAASECRRRQEGITAVVAASSSSVMSRSRSARGFGCDDGLYTQCETTQVREHGSGAAIFGYSKLYGQVPGGQAEYLRVPQAQFTHIKVPDGPSDDPAQALTWRRRTARGMDDPDKGGDPPVVEPREVTFLA